MRLFTAFLSLFLLIPVFLSAQPTVAPERAEGDGPFDRLIIRGATLINGNGAPPTGPVDIVVEGNIIRSIHNVGYPGVPINEMRRPQADENTRELDAHGMYILPGFVDMHAHIGGNAQGTSAEYVFKLWLAHGITTIREPGSFNGPDWTFHHRTYSEMNEITAPRIKAYVGFGRGASGGINNPQQARDWVNYIADEGADGIKFFGARPDIMSAALDEAQKRNLRTMTHHAQMNVAWLNVMDTAQMGLTSMEHWYGLPEALFDDRTVQHYRLDYNYMDEQHRFEEAGKLWQQAAKPGSDRWEKIMSTLLANDFTINPTFNIYDANRDLMRTRRAEWHELYTIPSLWDFFAPNRIAHGSYWFNWGTEQEVLWKENYRLWFNFINEYKNRGGRVTAGSDSGYIYQLYGFGYIRELEMLREAGFHPLEVIRAATLNGAEALGMADKIGTIEPGKFADFVIVEENPLQNLQVLYGTGAIVVNEDNEAVRVGGVKYTIKDGIIFDAKALLEDVRKMTQQAWEDAGRTLKQPGQ